eukprot:CAMPEP_0197693124 /NCGR_PEP_ID=MMETSP1338-20131121/112039_1 /TAXON_ID=43686 ORGANISM="Pelagodinium beii, Strain RCC1491" /NCGR_SAMPLE_ID=MMETSP1338 /ASSEMBLY_ACC=CAM_ASM_000754 /LENGTH=302 /DNA_ID=CAMNT_0043275837 /DNA_START=44 /DNA_END=949 /DNA_ORIENTATION=+
MTQLRNLNRERNEQFTILRRYFSENRVSSGLMGRVWAALQQAMGRSKRRVHENDIQILQLLPWTLKTELQEEVYAPIVTAHPFFAQFSAQYRMQMRKVYQIIDAVSLGIGQELFNFGENSERMYFVLSGYLTYSEDVSRGGLSTPSMVSAGHWLCEPVMWIKWKHTGQLLATTHCEFVALKASKVQEVLLQIISLTPHDAVQQYAKMFARFFKKHQEMLTDIWQDVDLLSEMAFRSFVEEPTEADAKTGQRSSGNAGSAHQAMDRRKSVFGGGRAMTFNDPRTIFAMSRNWAKSMEQFHASA